MDLEKKYREFCENAYNRCCSCFPNIKEYKWLTPEQFIDYEIKNILGAAFFAQFCGATFEYIDIIYNEYKEKYRELLNNEEQEEE